MCNITIHSRGPSARPDLSRDSRDWQHSYRPWRRPFRFPLGAGALIGLQATAEPQTPAHDPHDEHRRRARLVQKSLCPSAKMP